VKFVTLLFVLLLLLLVVVVVVVVVVIVVVIVVVTFRSSLNSRAEQILSSFHANIIFAKTTVPQEVASFR
jgi:heme/copper-type cytochrome/quinol oxidase subunit 2